MARRECPGCGHVPEAVPPHPKKVHCWIIEPTCRSCDLPVLLWPRWWAAMEIAKALKDERECVAVGPSTAVLCHYSLHTLIERLSKLARKALGKRGQ